MKTEQIDRMVLSVAAEPLDPLLRAAVKRDGIAVVAAACRGEWGSGQVPTTWLERVRAAQIPRIIEQAHASGLRWLTPGSQGWPAALNDLDEIDQHGAAPWGLWCRGRSKSPELSRALAVVGARACTTYGAEIAGDIAADLADRGWCVISGAAFGIDACAHRGALVVQGSTVAVLACGVDVPYPRAHAALLDRIGAEGWILSEHPPGAEPMKQRFLNRNRLIAALSAGTVVVEAARRSGSLNTLRWADLLGRSSMAVPGPVTSQQSVGTHRALRSGQAVLVTSANDVAEELDGLGWADPGDTVPDLTDIATRVHRGLSQSDGARVAALAENLAEPAREVRAALALLERRGLARRGTTGWISCGRHIA